MDPSERATQIREDGSDDGDHVREGTDGSDSAEDSAEESCDVAEGSEVVSFFFYLSM